MSVYSMKVPLLVSHSTLMSDKNYFGMTIVPLTIGYS